MDINIIPVELTSNSASSKPDYEKLTAIVPRITTQNLEQIFAQFLEMEVGDGAASLDTIKSYLSQSVADCNSAPV